MAATLYFSNRIEKLADRLAENLRLSTNFVDPFTPTPIIIPNVNLAKWLQLALCRRRSIVFNLQFIYLEDGLTRMVSLSSRRPESDDAFSTPLLDADQRSLQVLFALKNMALDQPDLAPISSYLYDQDGSQRPDYPLRIWQLSYRLAKLFQEYEYHREEMIENWLQGKTHAETDFMASGSCQRSIYRWIHQRREEISNHMAFRDSFFDRVSKTREDLEKKVIDEMDTPWHFFGLSHLSRFHLQLMDQLQPYFTMHLYTLNPCREFWEDIPSLTELRYHRRTGQDTSVPLVEHELLSAWGRPGRETMAMLCGLTDYEIREDFLPNFPETVLGRLQQSFLTLSLPGYHERLPQDRSIQIAACPGRRREVETVFNTILENLAQHDDLQLTDIAILVPDMAAYLPYIEMVFSGSIRKIAYNLVDSGTGGQSHYGQGVLDLFSLVETQLNRKAVFAYLQNPCVMHRFNITHRELTHWAEWVLAVGIFRSPDGPLANVSPKEWASRLFSWQQGLLRLRLGRVFTTTDIEGTMSVDHFQSFKPYSDIQSNDPDAVEHFCQVMETLFKVCDRLQQTVKQTMDWSERVQWACRETLSIPQSLSDEGPIQHTLFEALADLSQYDQLGSSNNGKKVIPLSFEEIKNYLAITLHNVTGGWGDYLTSGVTIAEMAPMRPIPFKVIFVLGLEAGSFPGRSDASALDLRRVKRRIGDVTLPERQRYLFLEILLSVREKLYLTYVSQDLDKDRELAPGSVLIQLRHYIENNLLPPDTRFIIEQIPLNTHSIQYLSSETISSKSDLLVNKSIHDRIAAYGFHQLWPGVLEAHHKPEDQLAAYGFDDLWHGVKERRKSAGATSEVPDNLASASGPETLNLDELRWFLLDPVDQTAKRRLGRLDQDPLFNLMLGSEDEPLFAGFPVDWQIMTDVLNRVVAANFAEVRQKSDDGFISAELDRVYEEFTRKNIVPQEPFASAEKKTLLAPVQAACINVHKLLATQQFVSQKYRRFVLGRASLGFGADIAFTDLFTGPAMELVCQNDQRVKAITVALNGVQDFIWQDQTHFWNVIVPMAYEKRDLKFPKQLINAALFYLAAKAGEIPQFQRAQGIHLYLAAANGLFRAEMTLDSHQARSYFSHLIFDYLSMAPPIWLPWNEVQTINRGLFGTPPKEIDTEMRQDFKRALIDAFDNNPPEKIGLLQSVITDDALGAAIQRFSIFPKLERVNVDDL